MQPTDRMPPDRPLFVALAACLASACATTPDPGTAEQHTASGGDLPGVEARTEGLERVGGPVPLCWDAGSGRVLAEVPLDGRELLYAVRLTSGLGSNDVGLDRGQLGDNLVVSFRAVGPRVLLTAPNTRWRSSSTEPAERLAARDSFADGVLWGFELLARSGERGLVDATDFLLRDAHGIAATLDRAGQGSFRLDADRSAVLFETAVGHPENSDVEVLLGFVGERPGGEVRATAAAPEAPAFRVRHAFVTLPDLTDHPFERRPHHPRSGFFANEWKDVSAPIDEPLAQRTIVRHHLSADEPIVYYVDRGAPEPVRTALLEGARYWEPVFAAAGWPGGYRVELLPEDADIYDVRFNTIQWVDRSTRGWSYGMTITDPRTGEILKGHVTLGALRVRQDVLLFEGLLSPYADGDERSSAVTDAALDRIRQLSAHEVGHTLGIAHNFAASLDGRASVMDYPAPRVRIVEGELDLSEAYRDGCGEWDELVVRYGYGSEGPAAALAAMRERGARFVTDADARGSDRAHPDGNLWDDGDPIDGLLHAREVRRIALARFGEGAVKAGRPLAELERVLVPLYLHHRYQLDGAARQIGGVHFGYDVRGDEAEPVRPVAPARQRAALDAVLACLDPEFLELPAALVERIPPPPPGYGRDREWFERGSLPLDPLRAAAVGAELVLDQLLDAERVERLVDQWRADGEQLSLDEVLDRLMRQVDRRDETAERVAIREEVRERIVEALIELASPGGAARRVQEVALARLMALRLDESMGTWVRERLRRFFEEPMGERSGGRRVTVPPGSPIGCAN